MTWPASERAREEKLDLAAEDSESRMARRRPVMLVDPVPPAPPAVPISALVQTSSQTVSQVLSDP